MQGYVKLLCSHFKKKKITQNSELGSIFSSLAIPTLLLKHLWLTVSVFHSHLIGHMSS